MPGSRQQGLPCLSSLPFSGATAAAIVAGLSLLLALFEAALTGLSRRAVNGPAPVSAAATRPPVDPARLRLVAAPFRVVLLALILLLAAAGAAAGSALPAVTGLCALALIHLLEQQGRLRLFGARAPWLAAALAFVLEPAARLLPAARKPEKPDSDAATAEALEDLADLLATAPQERQEMVEALLNLERSTVEDIMVPRNDVDGIDLNADWDEVVDLISRTTHTRLPLYEDDLNRVLGVVHMKRIASELALGRLSRERLREVATQRDALFVPEGTTLQSQLIAFRKLKRRLAFVVDEYGDVLGLVTLEDILEEIVGEFTTQPGSLHRDVMEQADGSYVVAGGAAIRTINRMLDWDLPTDGPRTLSGLIVEHLEAIPEPGTTFSLNGHRIEILQIADNTVRTAKVWSAD
jgi:CBS domain containing-hemolysin-like protein